MALDDCTDRGALRPIWLHDDFVSRSTRMVTAGSVAVRGDGVSGIKNGNQSPLIASEVDLRGRLH